MSRLEQLGGKVAVVTGGASGIGKGIAQRLIAQGMKVVIADVEQGSLEKTAAEIGATGIRVDVSDIDSVQALAAEVQERFGAVHVLCNNAGVGSLARIADMTVSDWRWMVGVNLWGVIHGVTAFLPMLLANPGGGHIVNTASVGGLVTMPGLGPYSVTKFGVVALSEALAQEMALDGSKVGVTVLCPGPVRTNIKSSSRNRPAALGGGALTDVDLETSEDMAQSRWIDPQEVGDIVVRAIRRGDLYAFTHPEMAPAVEERQKAIAEALHADATTLAAE